MNQVDALQLTQQVVAIPHGYLLAHFKEVKHDTENVVWLRFVEKNKPNELGGEHFSVTINPHTKQLKGYMHIKKEFCFDENQLPSEQTARELTFKFLEKHGPDILQTIEVRWIKPIRKSPINPPHDQGFPMKNGDVVTGMRVKLWNHANEKYSWVIVGQDGIIISYERDIGWDSIKHCRTTDRWLHDDWLADQKMMIVERTTALI